MSATHASWWARCGALFFALVSFTLVSSLSFTSNASAQEEGEIDALDSAARAIFEDGRRAFESGDFETALSRFQNAYDISHRPLLLWNIATTLDRLRRDEEALTMFESYLEAVPDAANRVEVTGRIRSLRESVDRRHAEHDAAEAERAAREAEAARLAEERAALERERAAGGSGGSGSGGSETAPSGGGITPVVFIVGASLTAISAGILIWSGLDTLTANDNYTRYAALPSADYAMAEDLYNQADGAQLRTNVLVGITAGLGVASVILAIFTDWDGDPPPASAAPSDADGDEPTPADPAPTAASFLPVLEVGPTGGYVGLTGSF